MRKVLFAGVVLSVWGLIRSERKRKQERETLEEDIRALQKSVEFLRLERDTHIKRMRDEGAKPWVMSLKASQKQARNKRERR